MCNQTANRSVPNHIRGEAIEVVSDYKYLGSIVDCHGEIGKDIEERIAKASKHFGALRKPVFMDGNLSNETKKLVYIAIVPPAPVWFGGVLLRE